MSRVRKQEPRQQAPETGKFNEAEEAGTEQASERVREAGLSGTEVPGKGPTADDQAPDTITDENAVNPSVNSRVSPAADRDGITGPEEDLSIVGEADIGGGEGADEAELGRIDPLDGKPWDGDESEPLNPAEATDENFPAEKRGPASAED